MRQHGFSIILGALALILGLPSMAAAQDISKAELLEADLAEVVDLARQAFDAGDYDIAVERLQVAHRLQPTPRLFINIGRSLARAGDCRSALGYYYAYLRHPNAESELFEGVEATIDEVEADCDEDFDEASFSGRVLFESTPLLATVYLNDELVGTTPMELIALPIGTHQVRIESDGYEPFEDEISLRARRDHTVDATLQEESDEPVDPGPVDPIEPPPGDASSPPLNPIALGLVGGGAVLLGVGLYTDLVTIPRIDQERADAIETHGADSPQVAEFTQTRQSRSILALSTYIAGGMLLAGGAAWLIYDFVTHEDDAATSWRLAPEVQPNQAGLQLMRRF